MFGATLLLILFNPTSTFSYEISWSRSFQPGFLYFLSGAVFSGKASWSVNSVEPDIWSAHSTHVGRMIYYLLSLLSTYPKVKTGHMALLLLVNSSNDRLLKESLFRAHIPGPSGCLFPKFRDVMSHVRILDRLIHLIQFVNWNIYFFNYFFLQIEGSLVHFWALSEKFCCRMLPQSRAAVRGTLLELWGRKPDRDPDARSRVLRRRGERVDSHQARRAT